MADDYSTTGRGAGSGIGGAGSTSGGTGGSAGGSSTLGGSGSGYGSNEGNGINLGDNEQLQNAMRTTQERMQQARDFVANHASERPMVTTAVALGAGVLIGMMMGAGGSRR